MGERAARTKDLAFVYAPAEDGDGFRVLRKRGDSDQVDVGTIRPLKEGRAITGEVVQLKARDDSPLLFDCETDEELSTSRAQPQAGPAQVATDEYRRGWDAIWGRGARPAAVN
jgi:hypothetical protein